MLWSLAWRIIIGLEDEIVLQFLIAGHTKNRCDGSFGLVKRQWKELNMVTISETMQVISKSSEINRIVCSTQVKWINFKDILNTFFTVAV